MTMPAQTIPIAATPEATQKVLVDNAEPAWAAIIKPLLASTVRTAAVAAGGFLVKKGITDADGATQIVGATMSLAALAWSWAVHYGAAYAKQALSDASAILHAKAEQARAANWQGQKVGQGAALQDGMQGASQMARALAWLVLPLTVAMLMFGSVAHAQDRNGGAPTPRARPETAPSFNLPDPLHLHDKDSAIGAGGGVDIKDLLAKPFLDLANFIGEDANDAITLATAVPGLQDGHGQGCWIATRKFAAVVKVHPIPLTFKAQADLESLRLLAMAAREVCNNVHCTRVFADLKNAVDQAAPLKAPNLTLNFHDVCALVPTVAVVEPVLPVPPDPGAPSTSAPSAPAQPQTAPATNPNP